ncbi:hypothetical protein [Tritonibacter horizontis]|uniref:Uncharacterized protein n=1 Tax=Tritonibacter horizontis TaxID=1768241 RepID=A0A132BVM2_9RHOB|nr:hypothetical protein [Tritonibacter horizontis]KUP92435.1 hypothetical protein TRIHO_27390 [Tritonibacter horizontis]
MTWASFGWGGSSWGKSYSFGGKSDFGGKFSSWTHKGWTYDSWSGCSGKSKSWFDKDDDQDKDDDKHGWDFNWGRGKHKDDDDRDDRGKDCDDEDDDDRGGRGGHGKKWWDRDDDDDRGGRGKKWWDRDDDDKDDRDDKGCGRDEEDDDKDEDDEKPDTGEEDGKITVDFTLGDSQQVTMEVSQTAEGSLFFKLAPTSWDSEVTDIDGIFMNLSDDSTAEGLHIYPEANDDANAIPLTGKEIDPNGANSLSDGTTLSETFDIGLQFGQVDDSSEGLVQSLNFTLWSDNGPLTLEDVDLSRIALVTGLDNDAPEVIVGGLPDAAGATLDDVLSLMTQDVPEEDEEEPSVEEDMLEMA